MEDHEVVEFPGEMVVDTPASVFIPGQSLVFVRSARGADITDLRKRYGARLAGWELVGEQAQASSSVWEQLEGLPVRVRVNEIRRLEDSALQENLRRTQCSCTVSTGPGLLPAVLLLSSLEVPVRIDTASPVEAPDDLLAVVEHYLHSETLRTRIEPIHGLLQALSSVSGLCLWQLESEDLELNAYVTEDGRVTLSRRWAEAGLAFGRVDESADAWQHSEFHTTVSALPAKMRSGDGPCATCEVFGLCQGFLRAVDIDRNCEAWQRALLPLVHAVQAARRILQEGSGRPDA